MVALFSHLLLGILDIRVCTSERGERKLYKLHCAALHNCNIFRSEYWDGTLEGNSCSKLLDHLEYIPFPKTSAKLVNALIALKHVKETCLCNVRKFGWQTAL